MGFTSSSLKIANIHSNGMNQETTFPVITSTINCGQFLINHKLRFPDNVYMTIKLIQKETKCLISLKESS